ncbi:MAG: PAS domain S-box protein [Desulfobacteraceae bacterium]
MERYYKAAFEEMDMAIIISSSNGHCLAVNPHALTLTGYSKQELIGKEILGLFKPDAKNPPIRLDGLSEGKTANAEGLLRCKDGGMLSVELRIRKKMNAEPCEPVFEKRYIHKDRRVIWGLVSADWIKNDDGTRRMAIAHIQDITNLKVAEEAQKNLQVQLAAAMELAHLGHWEYDVKTDTFTFNDHFYRIFRTTAEKVGGYTMSSEAYASRFIHPDDRHLIEEEVQRTLKASEIGVGRKMEHRILYEDGTIGYISVHYFAERDKHNRMVRTYGINQDITDRKRAEEERKKLEDQFRQAQKMESIGLLAGGVAHDFNNLLTPILGYTDILSLDMAVDEKNHKQLKRIRAAAERAKDVAQRLFAFSRKQLLELKKRRTRLKISRMAMRRYWWPKIMIWYGR